MDCECDDFQHYIEYVLLTIAIIEQILSYSPDGYPKSLIQGIVFIIYQVVQLFKKPKEEENNNNELIDIVIK